jgi:hypothetical protein
MNVVERMKLVQIIEKMNDNKEFAQKIGLRDTSVFRKVKRMSYELGNMKEEERC